MKILLNGLEREITEDNLSVSGLLEALNLGSHPVLVERNGLAVLKREFDVEPVTDGDVIEIVRMVAGG
ncbi:MAG: sulfur carrier protein ThiS [Verrucomicrobiae bacterium]|nr:sulfur carrier protein ThiS [Verrucomicrobiae bacterium]